MSRTGAAFSVRFLRNGDQVITTRDIINRHNNGLALFQVVETMSGTIVPNWDATGLEGAALEEVLDAQPIIRVGVRSSYNYPTQINSVVWKYHNDKLNFALNGETWVTASNDSKFQARINGAFYELQIIGNLASAEEVANRQITYDVEYVSNGMTDTVQGSVDVLIQAAGSNSHLLQIKTDRVELDAEHESATITAVGMYGTQPVTINHGGYTIKWYQDGRELNGQAASTLNVTRAMVEGGSIFIAKLFLNGEAVAQDSQRINDIADEYQIMAKPTDAGANWVGVSHNATYNLSLLRNGKDYAGSDVSFAWTVYNAMGVVAPDGTGTGPVVTVTSDHAKVGTGETAYYADCDVQVTAEF